MLSCHGNLYSVAKEILRRQGIDIGEARLPLPRFIQEDLTILECVDMIEKAKKKFC